MCQESSSSRTTLMWVSTKISQRVTYVSLFTMTPITSNRIWIHSSLTDCSRRATIRYNNCMMMECSTTNLRKWTEPASTRTGGSTIQRQTSRTHLSRLTELLISMRVCPSLMQSTLTLATFQHREETQCPATQARWWQRLRTGTPLAASSLGRLGYRTGKLVASR